ncbi:MAG: molybdopterin biosynthesis protein [Desulfobacterales bacterium]
MKPKRNVYLNMKTLEEAGEILLDAFPRNRNPAHETVDTVDAVDRILSGPVFAEMSSPNFHAAAMDGIAVKAAVTFGAHEANPKVLRVGKEAHFINTGHVMPKETDAVIMIEHIQVPDAGRVVIESPVVPWQNVRKMGEDIVATELLFSRNHKVSPYSIGALLSAGVFNVNVLKKPKIMIIPTGSELVDWHRTDIHHMPAGRVIETNSFVLGKMAEAAGAEWVRHERIMDDILRIKSAAEKALSDDFDMVLILGGSSAGSEDYSRPVIEALGSVLVHGVTMMPGKPVVIGKASGRPIFGVPGYPVSAIIVFEQLIRPVILNMLGQTDDPRPVVPVKPTRKIASKLGTEEFLRVKLGRVEDRIVATPLPRGAGSITTLTEADGIIRIPHHIEGLKDDDPVTAELLRPLSTIQNTIVIVGSHDNTLDILADEIRCRHDGIALSSSHVGSMGGLTAVKRRLCHLAGSHLLDTETGGYNISYVKKYLPETPVCLVNLVLRDQGFIIPKNNPKHITGIEDLCRDDIRFINRQAGSGTRILLDFQLARAGISPDRIRGYHHDEFTHMAVAVAVLSGAADVGLGIHAAAGALDLAFIPLITEQYDLIIPEQFMNTPNIRLLIETIQSGNFKRRVLALGGYHTEKTGTVVWRSTGA